MTLRSKHSYEILIEQFLHEDVWVACPGCGQRAIVRAAPATDEAGTSGVARVVCVHCGYSKHLATRPRVTMRTTNGRYIGKGYYVVGSAVDPLFHLPLWLQKDFGNETFWAYNLAHLAFLRDHVGAKLRERNRENILNRSLGSRLPRWMVSEKNRAPLLKLIDELFVKT